MLDEGVAFARETAAAGSKLLVHCHHGIGRSALVALCVLVDRGHPPLDGAGPRQGRPREDLAEPGPVRGLGRMGRPPRPPSGAGLRGLRRHRLPPPPGRGLTCSSTAIAPRPPRQPDLLAQLAALDGGDCDRRTEALIVAGQLAQGLADAETEASGADDATPLQAAALALATAEAAALLAADGQPASGPDPAAARARLAALPLPPRIRCRTPEGFAFYALAPQAVAAAAARVAWERPPLVIGIRSIGTTLAAVVAARLGGRGR